MAYAILKEPEKSAAIWSLTGHHGAAMDTEDCHGALAFVYALLAWIRPTAGSRRPRSTSVRRLREMKFLSEQQAAVAEQPIRMIRWPDGPTSSNGDSTFRIGRKKADEDQLQPTVWNTLRKLSRPTKKNCPTADRRLGVFLP
ncbi:hypothetical protein DPX16_13808 [Anabarilius grahami]|uniref:Uncharacterized protein n=1 Tax=Anabarilius grahami TaxID=495550 RepID=A0A3N0XS28_ANAGA|nr:hypothetical protein DPX16_13808 [Anabarilius grahami]